MDKDTSAWDPQLYERFKQQREQPAHDLMAKLRADLLPGSGRGVRCVDLGCGTGSLTARLHQMLPAGSETLGIDNSETMLAKARSSAAPLTGLTFQNAGLREFAQDNANHGRYDVVFSNAAFHWVDDHQELFDHVAKLLSPGGQLLVQIPHNHQTMPWRVAAETAQTEPFATALHGYVAKFPQLPVQDYSWLLSKDPFTEHHVQLNIYSHTLPDADAIVAWLRGATLTAYQSRMTADMFDQYVSAFSKRVVPMLQADSAQRGFPVAPIMFKFRRVLMWARR